MYKKKNIVRPFEDVSKIEFFSQKCDASLFAFGSHNKKRPDNLVIGRMFDHQLLDMVEFGVSNYSKMRCVFLFLYFLNFVTISVVNVQFLKAQNLFSHLLATSGKPRVKQSIIHWCEICYLISIVAKRQRVYDWRV